MILKDSLRGSSYNDWTKIGVSFSYLTHFSVEKSFFYAETPKVCCTTIKRTLQLITLNGRAELLPIEVHDRGASPILPLDAVSGIDQAFFDGTVFAFCYVRNPFTRALSAYLDKMIGNDYEYHRIGPDLGFVGEIRPTFFQFLDAIKSQSDMHRDIHFRTQSSLLDLENIKYDFIGRFEYFSETFPLVVDRLSNGLSIDLKRARLDEHKTAAGSRLQEYYTGAEIKLVREIYSEDFDRFGYGRAIDFAGV